ncbi:hypothetical protein, partial [Rhodovulum sp. 12E13]|uniref:hypothetical protein n=1 Tax=Rhodovulum sp. 12E13 TaxID=2203891 RepID=UPI001F28164E
RPVRSIEPAETRLTHLVVTKTRTPRQQYQSLIGSTVELRRPASETEHVNFGLKNFTYGDFWALHEQVRNEGHRTRYGKYYDDLWDAFADDATWREAGRYTSDAKDRKRQDRARYDYTQAKSRHEDLLRSLLIDRYCEFSAKNKPGLFLALTFAVPGYVMFLLPSLDLRNV